MTTETERQEKLDLATKIGEKIGRAIARDTIADGLTREWTGLDAADADVIFAAGIEFGSPAWLRAESEAESWFIALTK